jgi:hypothetical protein
MWPIQAMRSQLPSRCMITDSSTEAGDVEPEVRLTNSVQ